ncbi:MAG: L-serine ammonia-lyase, partial [Acidobacteriaceae bacterium]
MKTSLFDLYKVGIGPSSSHTMGPMRAARRFATELESSGVLPQVAEVRVELYGSLALTGRGHGTDRAVLLGLSGEEAATIDPGTIDPKLAEIRSSGKLSLLGGHTILFRETESLILNDDQMVPPGAKTQHPNGVRFISRDAAGRQLMMRTYFSIGGGFVIEDGEEAQPQTATEGAGVPYPFTSAAELLRIASEADKPIWAIMLANESASRPVEDVRAGILRIWNVMLGCIERGMRTEGILPGGLSVRRRAPRLVARLREKGSADPLAPLDWVTVYAMAVNEENAAGGRVVTAPTNGAAGVIPAVGRYYLDFIPGANEEGILRYFLTSAAIG